MSTSVLLVQRLKVKAKERQRRPLGHVPIVLVHPDPRKRHASFSPLERANGETNAPLSMVAATLPRPPLLRPRKTRLRARLRLRLKLRLIYGLALPLGRENDVILRKKRKFTSSTQLTGATSDLIAG